MTEADIGDTLAPKSDQLDAVDLATGPRIFTVTECRTTNGLEQPTTIRFAEFPRPWKPGKNQRRVLAFCWGEKGALYVGRRVELYCDTTVVYAGEKVGGIRIRALSHIDGPMDAPIIPTRGKGGIYHVEPLTDAPAPTALRTQEQANELGRLLKSVDLTDPAEALPLMSGWIGRTVETTKTLTADECATVIECLREIERKAEALAAADESGQLIPTHSQGDPA